MKLDNAHLADLPAGVARPAYDRSRVTPGIVHIGVGGFHRAHQAMYLDRLMNAGTALDWGIVGLGILPGDARMHEVLQASDGLYTLVVKHPDGSRDVRVIGSIVDHVHAPADPAAAVERLADPAIRIVSLTITEGGYNYDRVTGEFDLDDEGVQHDLAHPEAPRTVFGLVVAGLRLRRERGVPAFTVMSCDNIQGNGHVARSSFTAFARALDERHGTDLAAWMTEHVAFPSSMVDRITPATTDADRADVAERHGVDDAWPVVTEDFEQWALEDTFTAGRPPFEQAGVQVVADVEPYELMKLRLLNASHQALAYVGWLAGYRAVHDAVRDPLIARLLRRYMDEEGTPTLAPVPGVDLDAYKDRLIERFTNEHVADTVARLAAESSDRIPTWLMPVVRENLAAGRQVELSAAVVASWARYAEGVDEHGAPIRVVDRLAERLTAVAQRNRTEPTAFLADRTLFGDVVDDERFTAPYVATLTSLHEKGVRATLEALLTAPVGA
ncbi:mannitol dehydrogenase family protein [Cellulomonas sp. JZ18]|uniref:mannitol dehydrogenase family protein n=1 Tax=Cellulomonas sp. JZ18 TaxID=2654191 RepID=UPI0012D3A52F|nr:mannitol dehydrogenase family protein [Cellulomonas sp. JZ18]QGQ18968.1 mannitol dehydrogenase family protein [Cellulomonas sp. JZ18]